MIAFVHISKCAGKSVIKALNGFPDVGFYYNGVFAEFDENTTFLNYHYSLVNFKEAWKFAIIREPFQRILSAWLAWKIGFKVPWSFEEAVDLIIQGPIPRQITYLENQSNVEWRQTPEAFLSHCHPYADEVSDLDLVIPFPKLKEKWFEVCKHLGECRTLEHINSSAPAKLLLKYATKELHDIFWKCEHIYAKDRELYNSLL